MEPVRRDIHLSIRIDRRVVSGALIAACAVVVVAVPTWLAARPAVLPHTFANATLADATAVNANFSELDAAIDDEAARLAAIESAPVTLGGIKTFTDGIRLGQPTTCTATQEGLLRASTASKQLQMCVSGTWTPLDAGTLDGLDSTSFLRRDVPSTATAQVTFNAGITVNGTVSATSYQGGGLTCQIKYCGSAEYNCPCDTGYDKLFTANIYTAGIAQQWESICCKLR